MSTLILNSDGSPMTILPISTLTWNDAIKLYYLDKVEIIEFYDDWVAHSPSTELKIPSIVMTKDYFNVSKAVTFSRDNLLLRDNYTCQYCGFYGYHDQSKLTMDHVHPRFHGGETKWDNITIACQSCNTSKGHKKGLKPNTLPRKPTYYELVKVRKEYPVYIADKKWIDYLDWNIDKILINSPNKF